jgi:hypothetical protein
MAGSYLEAYGEAEQRRARRRANLKWSVVILVSAGILGLTLFSIFENYGEEQQVKAFVERLKAKDYQAAYRMWGCTETTPCRDYSFQKFMDDWGPGSPHANAATAEAGSGDTCGTGVVIAVDFKGSEQVPLWIDRTTRTIGFSPDPECRKKRWHFREFFRNLFPRQSGS